MLYTNFLIYYFNFFNATENVYTYGHNASIISTYDCEADIDL